MARRKKGTGVLREHKVKKPDLVWNAGQSKNWHLNPKAGVSKPGIRDQYVKSLWKEAAWYVWRVKWDQNGWKAESKE